MLDKAIIQWLALCILVMAALWPLTGSLTDGQVQRLSAITTLAGITVLVFYARETYLLRKTAERQFEASDKPILLIDLSSTNSQLGQPIQLREPSIRNIASGPAFKVVIEPMKGCGVEVEFKLGTASFVEGKQRLPLTPFITECGLASGMSASLSRFADLFARGKFPEETFVSVQYDSTAGKTYRSRHRVQYDIVSQSVSTHLVLPIDEVRGRG